MIISLGMTFLNERDYDNFLEFHSENHFLTSYFLSPNQNSSFPN